MRGRQPSKHTLASLASLLRGMVDRSPRRVIVGICGAPGAGKSFLAQALAHRLGPQVAAVVPLDGFHLAKSVIAGTPLSARRGAIETFDTGSYRATIARLRSGDEPVVYVPSFERELEDPIASAIPIPREVPLILTEGNYLLASEVNMRATRELFDAVWYLDTPEDVRLPQLIARHEEFGKTPDAAEAWVMGTDQTNADIIASTRELADLVITVRN